MNEVLRVATAVAAFALAPLTGLEAQSTMPAAGPGRTTQAAGWRVTTSPALDLWFHGLAVVGTSGFGVTPLYDPGYADRVRALKHSAAVPPSMLETEATRFRSALMQDSAFEVLHFLPLAIPVRDPGSLLKILRAVARGAPDEASQDPYVRRIAGAIAAALPLPSQRHLLGEIVESLDEEWRSWLRQHLEVQATQRAARAARAEQEWQSRVQPRIEPLLVEWALDAGTVFMTPALGLEGRFSEGDPANRFDNQIAVRDGEPDDMIPAMLREVCYPAVRRAITRAGATFGDRIEATRVSDRAATYCGSVLAARVSPELAARYQDRFAVTGSGSDGIMLPPAIRAALTGILSTGG